MASWEWEWFQEDKSKLLGYVGPIRNLDTLILGSLSEREVQGSVDDLKGIW